MVYFWIEILVYFWGEINNNGTVWGVNPKLINKKTKFVNQIVTPPFYKKSKIQEEYHELTLKFKGNYSVIFRAYNQGIAYRFATSGKDTVFIQHEKVNLNFSQDNQTVIPYVVTFPICRTVPS